MIYQLCKTKESIKEKSAITEAKEKEEKKKKKKKKEDKKEYNLMLQRTKGLLPKKIQLILKKWMDLVNLLILILKLI